MSSRVASRLEEAKYSDSPRGGSLKDDVKEQTHELRSGTKQRRSGSQLRSRAADAVDSTAHGVESTIYSLRNRAVSTADTAAAGVERTSQKIQQRLTDDDDASTQRDDANNEDEPDEAEGEEEPGGDWRSQLSRTGHSLLHKATDVGSSLRSRLRSAAPNLEEKLTRGVRAARSKLDEMQHEEDVPQSEEDENEKSTDKRDEGEEDDDDDTRSPLRSASGAARSALEEQRRELEPKVRSAARDAKSRLSDTADTVVSEVGPRTRSGLKAAQQRATELVDSAKSKVRDAKRSLRAEAGFDWHSGVETVEDSARRLKDKATGLLHSTPQRAASPDLSPDEEEVRASDEEEFSVRLEPMMNSVKRTLRHPTLPQKIIGGLFALWLLASLYSFFGTPVEPMPPTPTSLFHASRQYGDHLSDRLEGKFDHLREHTQELADLVVGRRVQPTLTERVDAWVRHNIFGQTKGEVKDAKHTILDGIGRVEDATYRAVDRLEGEVIPDLKHRGHQAADHLKHASERIIPGVRDGADRVQSELQYHRDHADSYLRKAKDAAGDVTDLAESKARDLGIGRKKTISERLWTWISGEESTIDHAHRMATDLKDRVAHNAPSYDEVKSRASQAANDLKETLTPHQTLGQKLRSYLPGGHPTVSDKAQDALHQAQANLQDGLHRARAHTPSTDDIKARSAELAREASDYVHETQAPAHPSVVDRLKDSLETVKMKVQDRVHHVVDALRPPHVAHNPADARPAGTNDLAGDAREAFHATTNTHPGDHIHRSHIPRHDIPRGEAMSLEELRQETARAHGPDVMEVRAAGGHPASPSLHERVRQALHTGVDNIKARVDEVKNRAAHVDNEVRSNVNHHATAARDNLNRAGERVSESLHNTADRARAGVDHLTAQGESILHDTQARASAGLHQARKEAEYIGHRTVHNAEKVGHRIEEGYDMGVHRVEEGVEKGVHRVEEGVDQMRDSVRYHKH